MAHCGRRAAYSWCDGCDGGTQPRLAAVDTRRTAIANMQARTANKCDMYGVAGATTRATAMRNDTDDATTAGSTTSTLATALSAAVSAAGTTATHAAANTAAPMYDCPARKHDYGCDHERS